VNLVGREVHVRMKMVNEREYWNFAWPGAKPKPAALGALQAIAAGLKDKVAEARKGSSKTKGAKAEAPPSPPANDKPLPDVAY
jgi:hypothetical protein